MFILVATTGEYEDRWETNVAVSNDKNKLIKYQKELEERFEQELELSKEKEELYEELSSKYPLPGYDSSEIPEDIAEREAYWQEYYTREDIWKATYWAPAYLGLLKSKGLTHNSDEPIPDYYDGANSESDKPSYSIEEVKEI